MRPSPLGSDSRALAAHGLHTSSVAVHSGAFTGDGDYKVETLGGHHMDHGAMILPNPMQTLARYASWMSLFEAAVHCFERRPQEHDAELGRQ